MTNRLRRLALALAALHLLFSGIAVAQTTAANLNGFDGFVEQVSDE